VQTSQHISCVKKLLYAIGRFAVPDSNSLKIGFDKLMNAYMTYYPNISIELAEKIKEYRFNVGYRYKQNRTVPRLC